jgi:hypothetical protein
VDRVDVEGNAHSGQHIKLPFASLFDTLGTWVSCACIRVWQLIYYYYVHIMLTYAFINWVKLCKIQFTCL